MDGPALTGERIATTIRCVRLTLVGFFGLLGALVWLAGCESKSEGALGSGGTKSGDGGSHASGGSIQTASGGEGPTGGAVSSVGGAGGAPLGTGGKMGSGGSGTGGASAGSGGESSAARTTFVYVGSGSFGSEPGKITVYRLERGSQTLELVSEHSAGGLASFLAIDEGKKRLFAADEVQGGVISFSIEGATGKLTSLKTTGHVNHPVSLSIAPGGRYLLGANYNEGNVDVYPIDESGIAEAPTQTIATGSHAHSVRFDDQGRVLVLNEGADSISHLAFNAGTLSASSPATSPSFSPRHLAFHARGTVFVVSERGDFVTAYSREANGGLTELWQKPRLDSGQPTTNTGADIHLTPDGNTLYASNRGQSNTIVMYDIRQSEPVLLGHVPSGGVTPRNFSVDPEGELVMVGNHGSKKSIALFRIGGDGKLSQGQVLETAFSPYFVTFARF